MVYDLQPANPYGNRPRRRHRVDSLMTVKPLLSKQILRRECHFDGLISPSHQVYSFLEVSQGQLMGHDLLHG